MGIISNKSDDIAGHPVTNQRKLLLEIIHQAEGHLDADELFRRAKQKEPRISLSTVYRNIKFFKEMGLISQSDLGDTHAHFEIKGKVDHYHLVCLSCGQVIDFDSPLVDKAVAKAQRENNFDIHSVHLKLEGYCSKCKRT